MCLTQACTSNWLCTVFRHLIAKYYFSTSTPTVFTIKNLIVQKHEKKNFWRRMFIGRVYCSMCKLYFLLYHGVHSTIFYAFLMLCIICYDQRSQQFIEGCKLRSQRHIRYNSSHVMWRKLTRSDQPYLR